MKEFDLNIEKVLENWTVSHAIREIIANALDEQVLSGTKDISIYKEEGTWHIRDFGRGLQYIHFTQNENDEKLAHANLIGKFGVGLKDALATFDRHNVIVTIDSKYGHFSIGKSEKHGFEDLTTLHAYIDKPINQSFIGTDFKLTGCSDSDVFTAKENFLKFAELKLCESTGFGSIYEKRTHCSEIFINGIKVAEEENFLFSYNITSLNSSLRKALNRERSNVGRSAYSERIKSILLNVKSEKVIDAFTENLKLFSEGAQCDEMKWTDVQTYAVKLLSARSETVFMTPEELKISSGSTTDIINRSGKETVFVPETILKKIEGAKDNNGNTILTIKTVVDDYNKSFEYKFIPYERLTGLEKDNYDLIPRILKMVDSRITPEKVLISSKLRETLFDSTLGVFDRENDWIVIHRKQLQNREEFLGTLIHELAHADSGASDASRLFERKLTDLLGKLGDMIIELENSIQNESEKDTNTTDIDASAIEINSSSVNNLTDEDLEEISFSEDGVISNEKKIDALNELIHRYPDDADYWGELGIIYNIIGNNNESVRYLDMAISLAPNTYKFYLEQSYSLFNLGKYDECISKLDYFLKYNPDSYEGRQTYAYALFMKKEFSNNLIVLSEELWSEGSADVIIFGILLHVYDSIQKDYDKLLVLCTEGINRDPKIAMFHFGKCTALAHQGKLEDAKSCAFRATELEPDNAEYKKVYNDLYNACDILKSIKKLSNQVKEINGILNN